MSNDNNESFIKNVMARMGNFDLSGKLVEKDVHIWFSILILPIALGWYFAPNAPIFLNAKILPLILLSANLLVTIGLIETKRESERRKFAHAGLIEYIEGLRRYTVGNIEPLRESVAALHLVHVPQPPSEVPEQGLSDTRLLGTKERNTLLAIIAVLSKESKIDYTKHSKAAATIQNLADNMGVSIGETTIEGHLKKIPEAVRSRSK